MSADGFVGVKDQTGFNKRIDNETVERDGQTFFRQRVSSQVATWSLAATSGANAAVTVTRPGEAGKRHYITHMAASYDVIPTTGRVLDLKDGTDTVLTTFVADPASPLLALPLQLSEGNDAVLTLAAGGLGAVGKVVLGGYTL